MRVAVCVRPVPDPEARLELDPDRPALRAEAVPWVLHEGDEAALDAALTLGDALGAEVVALAAGAPRVEDGLRKALALGAAAALRVDVDEERLADPAVTGRVLGAAVRRCGAELVVTGAQSTAAGSGLTGPAIAAALGWPSAWLVLHAEPEGRPAGAGADAALRVVQELEGRRRRRLRISLPAVLAIQTGTYRPRMATIRGVLAAKRRTLETLGPDALGLDPESLAPRLRRVALERPPEAGGERIDASGGPAEAARRLVRRLREERVLE